MPSSLLPDAAADRYAQTLESLDLHVSDVERIDHHNGNRTSRRIIVTTVDGRRIRAYDLDRNSNASL